MSHLYLMPIIESGAYRFNKYQFDPRFNPTGVPFGDGWSQIDYGFMPTTLVATPNISLASQTFLAAQPDVFSFPDTLDSPVNDPAIDTFLDVIGVPSNWLNPATTWRQLLRRLNGLFQFTQRYGQMSGQNLTLIGGGRTLDSRWNTLSTQEQNLFEAVSQTFGDTRITQGNPPLRTVLSDLSDFWVATPFQVGTSTI